MNDKWGQFVARNLWWLSGIAVVATFDLLMFATTFWPHFFRYTDGDTFSESLPLGSVALSLLMFFASLLLRATLIGNFGRRRVKMFALGIVGALFFGSGLYGLQGHIFHSGWAFPIEIDELMYLALALLWSLSLVFVALASKSSET